MNIYTVKVQDDFFGMELSGKFEAATAAEAEEMAREDFAVDLDTNPQDIIIVNIAEEAKEMKQNCVVSGEDSCKKTDAVIVICYGQKEVWASRDEAIRFYRDGMEMCEGAEQRRYINIYIRLLEGCAVCTDEC